MDESILNNVTPAAQFYTRAMCDRYLTWKARGLVGWMLMHLHQAPFNLRRLESSAMDGIVAVRSGIEELQRSGYVSFDGAKIEVCLFTPEGGRYVSDQLGRFEVVLVGQVSPHRPGEVTRIPAMVLRRGLDLDVIIGSNQVETCIPDARLVDRVLPKREHVGLYRGEWVEVRRFDNEIHMYERLPGPKQGPQRSIDPTLPDASVTTH